MDMNTENEDMPPRKQKTKVKLTKTFDKASDDQVVNSNLEGKLCEDNVEEYEEIEIETQEINHNNSDSTEFCYNSTIGEDVVVDVEVSDNGKCQQLQITETTSPTPQKLNQNRNEKVSTNKKLLVKRDATTVTCTNTNNKKAKRRRDSGTSSEEERWLTAIESGKLEQVEDCELKKIKDPKLMTARQRAIYDRNHDTESTPGFTEMLMALPIGYKEKEKPQTAEEIQKAVLKSQKRKQLADEKREKDKKKTMERLLKKQESKQRSSARPKASKDAQPLICYRNTSEGTFIQMPPGMDFPLQAQSAKPPPIRQLCAIAGCGQPKVYNCSKTNLPLCSYACYRKNVQSLKEIMC